MALDVLSKNASQYGTTTAEHSTERFFQLGMYLFLPTSSKCRQSSNTPSFGRQHDKGALSDRWLPARAMKDNNLFAIAGTLFRVRDIPQTAGRHDAWLDDDEGHAILVKLIELYVNVDDTITALTARVKTWYLAVALCLGEQCAKSLERFGVDYIDLYYQHRSRFISIGENGSHSSCLRFSDTDQCEFDHLPRFPAIIIYQRAGHLVYVFTQEHGSTGADLASEARLMTTLSLNGTRSTARLWLPDGGSPNIANTATIRKLSHPAVALVLAGVPTVGTCTDKKSTPKRNSALNPLTIFVMRPLIFALALILQPPTMPVMPMDYINSVVPPSPRPLVKI
ncbi:hypothetical protein IW262DRAFT_1300385 [Armillaria fumosa]|nr:hypothetical protein IW262DRAFT_1300385 [Armillaria fumosa]